MRPLVLFLFLIPLAVNSQSKKSLKAVVLDNETKQAVIAANVYEEKSTIGTITDHNGMFFLVLPNQADSITISHIAYEPLTISISEIRKGESILLNKDSEYIDLVTISATPSIAPLTTYAESIVDFAVEENYILLLTRERKKSRSLKLINFEGKQLFNLKLNGINNIKKLTTSCMDTHFLLTEHHAYQLHLRNDSILIAHKDPIAKYNQFLANCIDANNEFFYFDYRKRYNQLAEIKGVHRYNLKEVNFGSVGVNANLDNFEEERKYLDFIDNTSQDDWINMTDTQSLEEFYNFWEKAALLKYNFYLPADCFVHADEKSVYILDHENHMLLKYTLNGKNVFKKSLFYSKNKNWLGTIYKDKYTEKLFTVLKTGAKYLLAEIDLSSGRLIPKTNLDLSFHEDLQIFDEVLYFTNSGLAAGQEARILKKVKI